MLGNTPKRDDPPAFGLFGYHSLCSLLKCLSYKVLSELLVRYNTAVPSSAAEERFFSQGKVRLKEKRVTLSNETFGSAWGACIYAMQQIPLEEHQ
jgi:hypothetical protein